MCFGGSYSVQLVQIDGNKAQLVSLVRRVLQSVAESLQRRAAGAASERAQGIDTLQTVLDSGCTAWLSPYSHFYRSACELPPAVHKLAWSVAPGVGPLRTIGARDVADVVTFLAEQQCSSYWLVACSTRQG